MGFLLNFEHTLVIEFERPFDIPAFQKPSKASGKWT